MYIDIPLRCSVGLYHSTQSLSPNALPSTSAMCARMLQEWEQYASSQVSLSREMQQLVELILRWRKLELE